MTLLIDPIWPWKLLLDGLSTAPPSVVAAVIAAGVVAFLLPTLLVRYSATGQQRLFLLGGGLVIAGLLAWAAVGHAWETPLEMTASGGGVWLARLTGAGLSLLFIAPMALAGLTASTYLGGGRPRWRVAVILALRAAAFVLAVVAILRPSLAFPREGPAGNYVLYIVLDGSRSMTIQDEAGKPRWEALKQYLRDAGPALDKLRKEQNVQVVFYRFDNKVGPFSPDEPGEPDGKRTDVGGALRWLGDQNNGRRVRAVLLLSDGRNNGGQRNDPFVEARRLRRLGPLYTFGLGSPNTPNGQKDVEVARVTATPQVIATKGKLTVRATINAHGFENSKAQVHLLFDDKEVKSQPADLLLSEGNHVVVETDAPDKPGEIKVTVKVDPLPGELNPDNNQNGTFVTVIAGGVNVLLIDKERAWEPQLIYDALSRDLRIQVKPVWIRGSAAIDPNAHSLFDFDKQKYDVIIIGDVTAPQLKAIQPDVLERIEQQVKNGAGLLMLGGYASFGGEPPGVGGWKGTPIERMLPVDLNVGGMIEPASALYGLKMLPTDEGLRLFLKVGDGDAKAQAGAWRSLQGVRGLEGVNRLALPNPPGLVKVLAESEEKDPKTGRPYPLLVYQDYAGVNRVLAFAGDTTHRWIHDKDSKLKHGRFWRQMILWLAKQDEGQDQCRVEPDVRSIAAGSDLGFSLHLRSKNGEEVTNGTYEVEVTGPGGVKHVTASKEGGEDRGAFRPETAGEYTIHAHGRGTDAEGNVVEGDGSAHVLAFEEEVEMAEWAADEDFMKKLADEGRGEYRRGSKLASFLEQLPPPPAAKTRPKVDAAPDWSAASWSPFFVLFFLLFTGVLAAEWFLRRRWGMV
jgi:hypothetical protein